MRNLITFLILVITVINSIYTYELRNFAKQSEGYFEYLELKTECDMRRISANTNDVYMAARGIRRSDLKGNLAEILPQRSAYDVEIPQCLQFGQYMCWVGSKPGEKYYNKCKGNL